MNAELQPGASSIDNPATNSPTLQGAIVQDQTYRQTDSQPARVEASEVSLGSRVDAKQTYSLPAMALDAGGPVSNIPRQLGVDEQDLTFAMSARLPVDAVSDRLEANGILSNLSGPHIADPVPAYAPMVTPVEQNPYLAPATPWDPKPVDSVAKPNDLIPDWRDREELEVGRSGRSGDEGVRTGLERMGVLASTGSPIDPSELTPRVKVEGLGGYVPDVGAAEGDGNSLRSEPVAPAGNVIDDGTVGGAPSKQTLPLSQNPRHKQMIPGVNQHFDAVPQLVYEDAPSQDEAGDGRPRVDNAGSEFSLSNQDEDENLSVGPEGEHSDEFVEAPEAGVLGPMRESQESEVDAALKDVKLPPNDRSKIIKSLMEASNLAGKSAADLIASGHLKDVEGYKVLLTQLKDENMSSAAVMSLKHADMLYRAGHKDLVFEKKEDKGQPHFDIDVGIKSGEVDDHGSGYLEFGYQLKEVDITNLKSASRKATRQLEHAPAEHKVALLDVRGSQAELTPQVIESVEERAVRSGVTHHLRFSDGTERTIPENSHVYPSTTLIGDTDGDRGDSIARSA